MKDFLIQQGLLPDFLFRSQVRKNITRQLRHESRGGASRVERRFVELMDELRQGPLLAEGNNENAHLEPPPAFFETVLGAHLKFSSGFWREGVEDIHISETDMMELAAWRADLRDGQQILELGCGWGAFSIFMALKFPNSRISALCLSDVQKEHLENKVRERGLRNVEVIRADIDAVSFPAKFDRVVSIEIFDKVRNYEKMLENIASVLKPDGKLFIHIFCHKSFAYRKEPKGRFDRVSQKFFSGGVMPSEELLLYFDKHFRIEQRWRVPGSHYQQTCKAWLRQMDTRKKEVLHIFKEHFGAKKYLNQYRLWRAFFMAAEELFGYKQGQEWFVSHYLFKKR